MVQKIKVLFCCDLQESDADAEETVRFRLGSTSYEIDVCAEHAQQIRDTFRPFVARARRMGAETSSRTQRERSVSRRERSSGIRA